MSAQRYGQTHNKHQKHKVNHVQMPIAPDIPRTRFLKIFQIKSKLPLYWFHNLTSCRLRSRLEEGQSSLILLPAPESRPRNPDKVSFRKEH